MTFVQRRLEFTIKLAQSGTDKPHTFPDGTDTVRLRLHRATVRIQNSGGAAGSSAQVSIWGMTPSLMNSLSTLGMVVSQIPRDVITISAGDSQEGMSIIFVGTIMQAYGEYNTAPDVPFRFECLSGGAELAILYESTSYPGATSVAKILQTIAEKNGWQFENNGVDATIASPVLKGSALDQVRGVADAARINFYLINNTLIIVPRNKPRQGTPVPLIAPAPDGQMIGYPAYTQQGILVRTVFDKRLAMGGLFKLKTSLAQSKTSPVGVIGNKDGTWLVQKLDLALDEQVPKGQWMSVVHAFNPQFPAPLPQQQQGV